MDGDPDVIGFRPEFMQLIDPVQNVRWQSGQSTHSWYGAG